MRNFWNKLPKPFFVLAPMINVTDTAFRQLFAKYGKPDVFYTEFTSCEALCSDRKEEAIWEYLRYTKKEKPLVAQIFGAKPEQFRKVGHLLKELGFKAIDINMGCPDKNVCKQGAGASMMKDPALAKECIMALKECGLPVSVKTRIGYNTIDWKPWFEALLSCDISALTVHLRTKKEMSDVPAHWELMPEIVQFVREKAPNTLIVGNGDVLDLADAQKKVQETGVDGVMIGRGAFGNPWTFNKEVNIKDIPLEQRLKVMVEHAKLFEKTFGDKKNFSIMKKHFKAYVNGFAGARELRAELMEKATNAKEVGKIVKMYLANIS